MRNRVEKRKFKEKGCRVELKRMIEEKVENRRVEKKGGIEGLKRMVEKMD